jgi:hypothetical protein
MPVVEKESFSAELACAIALRIRFERGTTHVLYEFKLLSCPNSNIRLLLNTYYFI